MILEQRLSKLHQRDFCLMTGNATSAIALLLKAAGICGKRVAIPASVCMNVPLAIYLSGNEPLYLDVTRKTLGLCLADLQRNGSAVAAVVAVHGYGSLCDIEQISDYCRKQGIFLIEDVAVAQGAGRNGRMAGSFGDASVLSFGAGKIIDVGHGGAILTDDGHLLNTVSVLLGGFSPFDEQREERISELGISYNRLYNAHFISDGNYRALRALGDKARDRVGEYCFRFDERFRDAITREVELLDDNNARRREKADALARQLAAHAISCFEPPEGSVYWRFTLFLERRIRNAILIRLLKNQVRISSWFPPVDMFFSEARWDGGVITPVSDELGEIILNVWVNHCADETYIEMVAGEIIEMSKRGAV